MFPDRDNCSILWHFHHSTEIEIFVIGTKIGSQQTSFKFSALKLFSQSYGELAKCSQNVSGGQYDVSKCLACRHILKSIVKELKEKKQKKKVFGNLN